MVFFDEIEGIAKGMDLSGVDMNDLENLLEERQESCFLPRGKTLKVNFPDGRECLLGFTLHNEEMKITVLFPDGHIIHSSQNGFSVSLAEKKRHGLTLEQIYSLCRWCELNISGTHHKNIKQWAQTAQKEFDFTVEEGHIVKAMDIVEGIEGYGVEFNEKRSIKDKI